MFDENLGYSRCNVSYGERLKDLKLFSLQRRRERFLILQVYKTIIKYIPNCGLYFELRRNGWYVTPKLVRDRQVPNWIARVKEQSFFRESSFAL